MPLQEKVNMHQLEQSLNSGWHLVSFAAYPNEAHANDVSYHLSVSLCDRYGMMDGRHSFLSVELDPANVQADLQRIKAFIATAKQKWLDDLDNDLRVVETDLQGSNTKS